ncbi:putative esterase [compost metagenome]
MTVSFGPIWLLTEKGQKEKSGLLNFFTTNVLKEVESKTGTPKSRIVFGESMGGLNSLVLGFKAGELFQKVASSCPAVYAMSPFSPIGEVQDFLKRTGADPKIVYGVIQLAKEFIKDQKEWDNFSPLQILNAANPKNSPEFYLSCGLYDSYGNYEGNELLAQKTLSLGFKLTWHPVYGGHCATDVVSLAEFLTK